MQWININQEKVDYGLPF